MSERFFITPPIGDASHATLLDTEAHHLAKVMRAKVGDEVMLFDGSGYEFQATVETIKKATVELAITSRTHVDREPARSITMAVALPKGDRQKFLVEKLVELGVRRLVPLETRRGVAQPVESALVRLRQQVIEASKQCRRNVLMEIGEPQTLSDLISTNSDAEVRLLAHPDGEKWPESAQSNVSAMVAIGPEGGFDDDEVQLAFAAGWSILSLGPRILRVETAAVAIAARLL